MNKIYKMATKKTTPLATEPVEVKENQNSSEPTGVSLATETVEPIEEAPAETIVNLRSEKKSKQANKVQVENAYGINFSCSPSFAEMVAKATKKQQKYVK